MCRSVHRRRVDHASARLEERGHHSRAFLEQLRVVTHVEGDPAPQADNRQGFARFRDRPRDHGSVLRRAETRAEEASGTREQSEMHVFRLHEHGLWATLEHDE